MVNMFSSTVAKGADEHEQQVTTAGDRNPRSKASSSTYLDLGFVDVEWLGGMLVHCVDTMRSELQHTRPLTTILLDFD